MAELPAALESAVFALTTVTLLYGLTSWCLIKNFRKYKNFVFLNAIFANFLVYATMAITNYVATISERKLVIHIINLLLVMFLSTVKHNWLIVVSHMFYVDIVKVFNSHIRKRHLKSALFGWVAPFLITLAYGAATYFTLNCLDYDYVGLAFFMLPLLFSCIIYIIIVCSLCRSFNASSRTDQCRRLYIATLIFLLSDIFLISKYALEFICVITKYKIQETNREIIDYVVIFLHYLNPIVLNIYFVIVKSNRKMWYEYLFNSVDLTSLASRRDQDTETHDSVIRELERQPTTSALDMKHDCYVVLIRSARKTPYLV